VVPDSVLALHPAATRMLSRPRGGPSACADARCPCVLGSLGAPPRSLVLLLCRALPTSARGPSSSRSAGPSTLVNQSAPSPRARHGHGDHEQERGLRAGSLKDHEIPACLGSSRESRSARGSENRSVRRRQRLPISRWSSRPTPAPLPSRMVETLCGPRVTASTRRCVDPGKFGLGMKGNCAARISRTD